MDSIFKDLNLNSMNLNSTLFDQTYLGVALLSLDFEILYINDFYANFLGYSKDELTGKIINDFLPGNKFLQQKRQLEQLLERKTQLIHIEHEFLLKTGKKKHAIVEGKLVSDNHGKAVGFLGTLVDITQRKRSEHEILVQNKINKQLADFSYRLLMQPVDSDIISYILNTLREITGAVFACFAEYSENDGESFLMITKTSGSSKLQNRLIDTLGDSLTINKMKIDEQTRHKIMNQTVMISDSLNEITLSEISLETDSDLNRLLGIKNYARLALRDPLNDSLIGAIILLFKNINAPARDFIESISNIISSAVNKRKAVQDMIQSMKMFDSVLDSSIDGIILINSGLEVLAWNKGCEKIFGKTDSEIIGKQIDEIDCCKLFEGREIESEDLPVALALKTGEPVNNYVMQVINCRKEKYWLKINAQPISVDGGSKIDQVVITFADITDMVEMEEKLKDSVAYQETLYRELRRRIKNTLAMIQSMVEFELLKADKDGVGNDLLELSSRVKTFSDLYEMLEDSAQLTDNIRMKDFMTAITVSVADANLTDEYAVGFETAIDDTVLKSQDAATWGLILTELFSNAYRYAFKAGGIYTIRTEFKKRGGHCQLKVSIKGREMTAADGGLGFRLIEMLSLQLGGGFEYGIEGEYFVFKVTGETE